ncbi:MAG: arginine N-succinyltransferase [Lentisphaeraceae bacterium]|nr:arginine N-succinyltransferase [Lentisphaeraceae bacterium]
MLLVRPVTMDDLEGIYALAEKTGGGLTTLPPDKERLSEKIRESQKNFQYKPSRPSGETYFLVMEDLEKKKIVGTSAIYSKVGGFFPFWTYEVKTVVKESKVLGVRKEVQYLQVKREHNGPSEVGTLFLDPEYRIGNNGRLLSLSRFVFVAQYRELFEDYFLAELRGRIDKEGNSVFWDCLGAHFFNVPFEKADLMVNEDKSFIDDLMPQHPIYIDLLPKEAQMVIGEVHDDSRPAMRLLEKEGFEQINEVDIFEAGPIVKGETNKLRCIKNSKIAKLVKGEPDKIRPEQNWGQVKEVLHSETIRFFMVANINTFEEFRVVVCEIALSGENKITLPEDAMQALNVKIGDSVRYVPVRPWSKL